MFDNVYEFKQYSTTFLKDLYIKPLLKGIKNPQDNATVEREHQVILNMLVTKDLAKNPSAI